MKSFDVSNDRLGLLYGLTTEENLASLRQKSSSDEREDKTANNRHGDTFHEQHEKGETLSSGDAEAKRHRTTKFRFKKTKRSRSKNKEEAHCASWQKEEHNVDEEKTSKRRKDDQHLRRRHHHSSSSGKKLSEEDYYAKGFEKSSRQPTDDPAAYDDTYLPNAQSFKYTDPDTAFRESLFDAMADDEGAAFWEGVYGQRVDIYPRPQVKASKGHLEQMDDEEYAAYVRQKMYEKTHEYINEERARREKARQEAKERREWEREEWERAEEEKLRREKARRERKSRDRLRKSWLEYMDAWARVVGGKKADEGLPAIPWPVETGALKDVNRSAIEEFYSAARENAEGESLYELLKAERVKWHPDKVQQRWGQLEEEILKAVNTTFQTIDALWVEHRDKKHKNNV